MIQSKQVQEWQAQARVETLAAALLEVLQERFGPVPATLSEQIRGLQDMGLLQRWLKVAARAATLEQFLQESSALQNGA